MPAKLTIQTQGPNRKYEKAPSSEDARATKSATSSTSTQGFHRRDPSWAPRRRPARPIEEVEEGDAAEQYDMYRGGGDIKGKQPLRNDRHPSLQPIPQPRYHEEDGISNYGVSDYGGGLIVAGRGTVSKGSRHRVSRSESRAPSRRPELRNIRVKVHAADVRYIMIGTDIEYQDFVDRIKDKFELKRRFKMKIKDEDMPEGDMITMGDQDDLDMAVQSSTSLAMRQGNGIAKMEVRYKTTLPPT